MKLFFFVAGWFFASCALGIYYFTETTRSPVPCIIMSIASFGGWVVNIWIEYEEAT